MIGVITSLCISISISISISVSHHLELPHSMRASCSALKISKLTPSFSTSPVPGSHRWGVSRSESVNMDVFMFYYGKFFLPLFDVFGDFEPMEII